MRKLIILSACLLAGCTLAGCKAKKMVTETETVERTDSNIQRTDSAAKSCVMEEVRTALTVYNRWGYIEFADSGGTLEVDAVGGVKAKGVRRVERGQQTTAQLAGHRTARMDSSAVHNEAVTQTVAKERKETLREPQKQGIAALKWYQRTIYRIGGLCCIAAIIYAIFLYMRRKR